MERVEVDTTVIPPTCSLKSRSSRSNINKCQSHAKKYRKSRSLLNWLVVCWCSSQHPNPSNWMVASGTMVIQASRSGTESLCSGNHHCAKVPSGLGGLAKAVVLLWDKLIVKREIWNWFLVLFIAVYVSFSVDPILVKEAEVETSQTLVLRPVRHSGGSSKASDWVESRVAKTKMGSWELRSSHKVDD